MSTDLSSLDELSQAESLPDVIERGSRLLNSLKREVHLARLEAQVGELEAALARAQSGEENHLVEFLKRYDSDHLPACVPQAVNGGWDLYLPFARARLSRWSECDVSNANNPATSSEPQNCVMSPPDRLDASTEIEDESPAVEPVHFDLGVKTDCVTAAGQGRASAAINRPMMSGMSLSLIGHVGLLLSLFLITYQLPQDSAGLGSQVLTVTESGESSDFSQSIASVDAAELDLEIADVDSTVDVQANPISLRELQTPDSASGNSVNASIISSSSSAVAQLIGAGKSKSEGGGNPSGSTGVPRVGGKFFGVGSAGNFFCYVVDSSGSMRGAAWDSAKTELMRSLLSLNEKQRFYIVFFGKDVLAIPEPGEREPAAFGLNATQANIDHARRWIETVKLDRGGPPNNALAVAIQLDPDAIYLLTDGVTKVDVCAFLREKNRIDDLISGQQIRVPIHAIAYHSLDGQVLLRQLAQENKGQFIYVPAR